MPTRLPEFIDPRRLARAGEALEGRLTTAGMARLTALIEGTDWAEIALRFGLDEDNLPSLEGEAQVAGRMQCQRCLEAMPITLHAVIRVTVRRPSEPPESAVGGSEAGPAAGSEWLEVEDGPISLAWLIEDELLLAVPEFPAHETCAPPGEWAPDETGAERDSPFSVLRALKRN